MYQWVLHGSMGAKDLIQTGDTFKGEYKEFTVIGHVDNGVEVENLAGMREIADARELIEMVTETQEPVSL